ncbi:hypothetical protein [Phytomonospora endophytica]|uniref:Uncharacterized protein n=1 Tax=Phytomonospora endophytica TaxID=714109 RepID=A0A841FCY9_9ACTN|nr:hypothetical protein [Phytomonospora endophytica]MBB6033285.1 hypothetical protein [Phytomonospora endophytica]GIG65511.1 hypothetical protein Pen01_18060 [Phytomonospora endophytica]
MKRAIVTAALAAGLLGLAAPAQADTVYYVTAQGDRVAIPDGGIQLAYVDASGLAHWQICGVNVLGDTVAQDCDNSTGATPPAGPRSPMSLANVDLGDAAHWQICGVNVLNDGPPATCDSSTG